MKILVVNWLDRENPRSGGAEVHLHEVFGRLAARGHDVTVLVSGWPGCPRRVRLDGMEVHRAGGRHTFSVAGPLYFRRHLSGEPFDVVVEDLNKVPVFAGIWTGRPLVMVAHHLFGATAFQAGPLPVAAVTWLLERTIPRVFGDVPTVAVSPSTRDDLVRHGLEAERIEVIPNGVDVDRFTPRPEEKAPHATLLFLGRLARYKRLDLVLEALALLARRGVHAELLVGGSGEQAGALSERAHQLGVSERVRFLGFVSESDKLDLLRSSWLHVLTSSKEGWGITNLEAAACGTPSVASDVPGLRDSIVDGETGVLVPHGDVSALARTIESLLLDRPRREAMASAARAFATRYSWEASALAMEALLERVVRASEPE